MNKSQSVLQVCDKSQSTKTTNRGPRIYLAPVSAGAIAIACLNPQTASAQEIAVGCLDAAVLSCSVGDTVIYATGFFSQYNPITALDMVQRVPGFSIDAGDDVRGFGGAAGNVLIDGQRPSTKSADIFQILSRISAETVERIDLIRGDTGGLDVGGQSVVVNVIQKSGADSGGSTPWELSIVKRRPNGGLRPIGEISHSNSFGKNRYTIGASAYGFATKFGGEEQITRFMGDDELRIRDGDFRERGASGNFKIERPFDNGDTVRFNVEGDYFRYQENFDETRFLAVGGPDLAIFTFPLERMEFEVGADYEHSFTDNFGVKLIGLYGWANETFDSGFEFLPAMGSSDQSIFFSDVIESETIGRLEFDWSGWNKHTIQFGGEIARNYIDSEAELVVDNGMGVLEPIDIAGANTRVSELRGEPFINDSWKLSPKLTFNLGFAMELSRIAQSGDNANSRFFTYPKPSATLTYNISDKTQLRLAGAREVNQLSFGEFVSSVNFDDEDVDFGNPDLQPQRSWALEASFEQRFGKIGVVEVTGFYDYVQDVEDLLPIGGGAEVPGNIGNGKIYGVVLDVTAPLDWMGLKNSRIESSITQRDSEVTDPVTGLDRDFSFREKRFYEIEFRQDLTDQKISWGWELGNATDEFGFGLDEVTAFGRDLEFDAFIETTVIKGVKIEFRVNDILNVTNTRDRTVFDGSRAAGIPLFREFRSNQNGGAWRLNFSGTL